MIRRIQLTCMMCGVPLNGELDTYGDIGSELCADCWYDEDERINGVYFYGLAPHIHDLTITGSYLGSTVYLDYQSTAKRDERGRYWIEHMKMWFSPDDEVDGYQGMWEER